MKPTRFAYVRPGTVQAALACLTESAGAARVLAGGQSLIPLLNQRLARPAALVSLERLDGLRYLACDGGGLRIGALTRHADIENTRDPRVRSAFSVLPESARLIAHWPVRTRGTLGGSIAHADPAAEWCLLAVLLDAEIAVQALGGARVIPAGSFFLGPHRTALRWDELVVEIRFPHPAPTATLVEFGVQEGQLPLAAAAAALGIGPDGTITAARVAVSGVADRPVRLPTAEAALSGSVLADSLLRRVAQLIRSEIETMTSTRADAQYQAELATALTGRALQACVPSHRQAAGTRQEVSL